MTDQDHDEQTAKNFWKTSENNPGNTSEKTPTKSALDPSTQSAAYMIGRPKTAKPFAAKKERQEHVLKAVQPYFDMLWSGKKNFELRKNDRDYKIGDLLFLHEYDPSTRRYAGRYVAKKITHILDPSDPVAGLGLNPAWVLLFLGELDDDDKG